MAADRGTDQQGNKIVATTPNVAMWPAPTRFDPVTATSDYGTNLDRISRTAQLDATRFVNADPFNYDAASPEQRAAYNQKYYGQDNAPTIGTVDIQNPNAWAGMGGGGGGSSDPRTSSNALNWLKYQNELASATAQREAQARKYKAMQDYYNSNAWANPYAQLGSQLDAMQTTGRGQIDANYQSALADILGGYDQASQMTGQGYDALSNYLNQYTNPYAGASFTAPDVADVSGQYDQYNLNSPEIAQQAAIENAYNAQGSAGFNTLYDALRRASDMSQQSRLNEAQMARNFANQQLLAGKGAYTGAAAKQRQSQLDQLINSINEQRFQLEQAKATKGQTLQEQLLESVGDAPAQAGGAETKAEQIQRLASEAGSFKEAVKQFAPAYIAKNPKATVAELKKKFPALAAAF